MRQQQLELRLRQERALWRSWTDWAVAWAGYAAIHWSLPPCSRAGWQ